MECLIVSRLDLFLGILVLLVLLEVVARILDRRSFFGRFKVFSAAMCVVLLPLVISMGGNLLLAVLEMAGYPELEPTLKPFIHLLVYLSVAWAGARLVERYLQSSSDEPLSRRMSKLSIGLIYILFFLLAITLFVWKQGYTLTGLWVSTGVAAAFMGFTLQRTLGDLLAGMALNWERPFVIGDWLELPEGTGGQVVDINWRATHLRGWDNTTHVIPNSRMAWEPFKNLHGEDHPFAPWYHVQIPAEVNPRLVNAVLLDAAMQCKSVMKQPVPVVRLVNAEGPPFRYMVWVHLKNYPTMFQAREELYREIHHRLQILGIKASPAIHELRTRRAETIVSEPPPMMLVLKSMEILKDFSREDLEKIAARSEYRLHRAGDVLLAQGAASDAFYIVAGGLVDSVVRMPDGSQKVLETLGPGKYFGIGALLAPEPSSLEFIAKAEVTLIRIDLECVSQIAASHPEFVDRLAVTVKRRMEGAESIRTAHEQYESGHSLRDIRQRIRKLLQRRF